MAMDQQALSWEEALSRLSELDWRIGQAPWTAVFAQSADGKSGKMLGGKENTNLLQDLLRCHIAPQSKQAIKSARKEYKEIRGQNYVFTEEQLQKYLTAEEEVAVSNAQVVEE
jgi:DNA sulfur modification protein DndB